MAFTKITNADVANKGVIGLPDTPNMSATEIQQKFDELALDVLMPKHNALIDELEAGAAGASIGVMDGETKTNLQDRLDAISAGGYTKEEADEKFETIEGASETYLSQEDAASTYLSLEDASDDYLTKDDASDTYLSQTSAEDTYLSQSDASDTYLTKTDASSDYLTKTDAASEYLTQDSASGTYLTKTDASDDYLAKTDASTTYLSKTDASSTYVAKEAGKGLSTNDYDDTEKNKLAGIEAGANNYVLPVGNLTVLGGVKADGVTFNIDENGVGHAAGGGGSLDYNDLSNRPQINGFTLTGDKSPSDLEIALPQLFDTEITSPSDGQIIQYDGTDQVWKNVNYQAQAQADWNENDSTAPDYIKNKPTIPDAQIQSDWNQSDNTAKDFIKNKPTIPAAQVNADWNASSGVAEILNKPTIPDVSTLMNKDGSNASSAVTFSGAFTVGTRNPNATVGDKSFAQGGNVSASSTCSHAEGSNTSASYRAHAEGYYSIASGNSSHAEGQYTTSSGDSSHAEGRGIRDSDRIMATGDGSHAEGCNNASNYDIEARGKGAHAEGYIQTDYGRGTLASGDGSHAEGCATESSNIGSHAEGVGSTASGLAAHAEGTSSTASAQNAHAEGQSTASGSNAHSGGYNTTASAYCQFVHGNNNSGMRKFRGTSMTGYGAAFGVGFANTESTADAAYTGTSTYNGRNGTILNTATVTLDLEPQAMYLLMVSAYTLSSGAVYGSAVYLITAHGLSTGTPNNLAVKVSTNAPATVATAANNKITIKNGATSRATQFQLMRVN